MPIFGQGMDIFPRKRFNSQSEKRRYGRGVLCVAKTQATYYIRFSIHKDYSLLVSSLLPTDQLKAFWSTIWEVPDINHEEDGLYMIL